MHSQHRDVVASIAREAAQSGRPLDEALAAHVTDLAPIIDSGATALEVVQIAEQEMADMRRWIENYRRSKLAV